MTFVSAGTFNFGSDRSEPLFQHRRPGDTIEYKIGAYTRPETAPDSTPSPVARDDAGSASQSGSEIESLMQELKKKHEFREHRKSDVNARGVMESAIAAPSKMSLTSNLRLGNLAPHVTPQLLTTEFTCYGPILSTKVMIPRFEEIRGERNTCGFVLFAHRSDAERAKLERDGSLFHGSTLVMDWAPAPDPQSLSRMMRDMHSSLHLSSSSSSSSSLSASINSSTKSSSSPSTPKWNAIPKRAEVVYVVTPDPSIRREIDSFADYVVTCGPEIEQRALETEKSNPAFRFLFNTSSAEHTYFKWRLESFRRGDTLLHWNTGPMQIRTPDGPFYIPPPPPSQNSAVIDASTASFPTEPASSSSKFHVNQVPQHIAKEGEPLMSKDRDFLNQTLLPTISASRESICIAMKWCIEHDANAPEVVHLITELLTRDETKLGLKLALLFLVSDVIHNAKQLSSADPTYAAHLWLYPTAFYATLPNIMRAFGLKHRAIPGRISAQTLRDHVQNVLNGWKKQAIYMPVFLDSLLDVFCHPDSPQLPAKVQTLGKEPPPLQQAPPVAPNVADIDARIDGTPASEVNGLPIDFEAHIEEEVERIRKRRSESIRNPNRFEPLPKKQKL